MKLRLTLLCLLAAFPASLFAADGLHSLYADLLTQNPSVNAAKAGVEFRREERNIAQSHLLPSISLSGSQNQGRMDRTTPSAFGPPKSDGFSYQSQSLSLSVRQSLYRPGSFAELDQTHAMILSAEEEARRATQEMALKLISTYCETLYAQDQMNYAESQQHALKAHLAAATRGFKAGSGTRTDIDEAQAKLDVMDANLLEVEDLSEEALKQLESLVGRPVPAIRPFKTTQMELSIPAPYSFDGWLSLVEANSAELNSLRQQVASAEAEVSKSSAGHLPSVDLVASAGSSTNDNLAQLTKTGSMQYQTNSVGVQVNVPIYSGGAISADVRKNQAKVEQLKHKLEEARRRVLADVQKTHGEVAHDIAKIGALEKAERSSAQMLLSIQKGVKAGTRSVVDVLEAEQQLYTTRRDLAEARYKYVIARARLQSMAGLADETAIERMETWLDSDAKGGEHPQDFVAATAARKQEQTLIEQSARLIPATPPAAATSATEASPPKAKPTPSPVPEAQVPSNEVPPITDTKANASLPEGKLNPNSPVAPDQVTAPVVSAQPVTASSPPEKTKAKAKAIKKTKPTPVPERAEDTKRAGEKTPDAESKAEVTSNSNMEPSAAPAAVEPTAKVEDEPASVGEPKREIVAPVMSAPMEPTGQATLEQTQSATPAGADVPLPTESAPIPHPSRPIIGKKVAKRKVPSMGAIEPDTKDALDTPSKVLTPKEMKEQFQPLEIKPIPMNP